MVRPNGEDSSIEAHQPVAPVLPYLPRDPVSYRPNIGLIGCGGITKDHLTAYRTAGYHVVALCDIETGRARKRKAEFFPEAKVYRDYRDLLRRDDIAVVDIATHPRERPSIIEAALLADKHVLSQKPFVLDLDVGQQLVELAERRGLKLAVNQNGRWAPHFSYMREAIAAGLIGRPMAAHFDVHWSHHWLEGTEFEKVDQLILYDFAIHWFDIVGCFFPGKTPRRVYASRTASPTQRMAPPLLAQVLIEYTGAQASMVFDAHTLYGMEERAIVVGTEGTIRSDGPDSRHQVVTLVTAEGQMVPALEGCWFPDAFRGTMGELLCAIEEDREPSHSARLNLDSLALCFAAVASSLRHEAIVPGTIRKLP